MKIVACKKTEYGQGWKLFLQEIGKASLQKVEIKQGIFAEYSKQLSFRNFFCLKEFCESNRLSIEADKIIA